MSGVVVIDCFPESLPRYGDGYAIVGVDVIRATTTAVTAVAKGWRCFPVPSLEVAVPLAAKLHNPLLTGELGGVQPYGFHANNSPPEIEARTDIERPMILLSTSGTRVLCEAQPGQPVFAASLRNFSAQARYLVGRFDRVAIVGAGARGEFREEDQLCCAWIADGLVQSGYSAANQETQDIVERWRGADVTAITTGHSAKYLRDTGQDHDLAYILDHVDDLDAVFRLVDGELELVPVTPNRQ